LIHLIAMPAARAVKFDLEAFESWAGRFRCWLNLEPSGTH